MAGGTGPSGRAVASFKYLFQQFLLAICMLIQLECQGCPLRVKRRQHKHYPRTRCKRR